MDSRPLDLKAVEDEAHCRCPIIALLSQGSDPTALVLDLAKKHKKQARTHPNPNPSPSPSPSPNPNPNPKQVRTISLGQGQEPAARKLISTGVAQGSWVMLQNCHLGLKFMAEVETTMLSLYLPYISPFSPLYLAYISPISPLYLAGRDHHAQARGHPAGLPG